MIELTGANKFKSASLERIEDYNCYIDFYISIMLTITTLILSSLPMGDTRRKIVGWAWEGANYCTDFRISI